MQMPEYVEECRLYFGNLIFLLDSLYVKQYAFLGCYTIYNYLDRFVL